VCPVVLLKVNFQVVRAVPRDLQLMLVMVSLSTIELVGIDHKTSAGGPAVADTR